MIFKSSYVEAVCWQRLSSKRLASAKDFVLDSLKVEFLQIDRNVEDLSVKATDKLHLKHVSYCCGILFDVCNSQN